MKKYFALYLAPVSAIEQMMANSTPEQMKAGMDAWMKWSRDHEKSIVELGAPLGKTKRVTASGVSDVKNDVTGYTIVEAESHEEAAKLFEGHPHFQIQGSSVEVLEVVPMPNA